MNNISSLASVANGQAVAAGALNPKKFGELAPHPRLFVSARQIERMVAGRTGGQFEDLYEAVAAGAEIGVRDADKPSEKAGLGLPFCMQGRLTSLAIQWHRTRDRRYLEAAIKNIEGMRNWLKPDGEIQLWQGQDIGAVAVAYDLLYNDLTPEERSRIVAFAREHCLRPFLRVTARGRNLAEHGETGSWWQDIISNWNAVCNGGAGMLALAMYEEFPEAQTLLDRVDDSFKPIINYLQETEGGWVEGLGYWNWTVHYLSLFYMSYERATGTQHAGFRSPGFRNTLLFGQYFVPYDEACGFGDNQHGGFSESLFAAAEHLNHTDVLKALQDYVARSSEIQAYKKGKRAEAPQEVKPERGNVGYGAPQHLLIYPDPLREVPSPKPVTNMVHSFPKQGWGMVADRWPKPNIYAAVRGGELGGAHTHLDLLSWSGVVGIEHMIQTINEAGYYSTSFAWRASEIYERNPAAKNTLFIGGISACIGKPGRASSPLGAVATQFMLPAGAALRLDATQAFLLTRNNPQLVCRLFVVLGDKGLLVLDRVTGRGCDPVEVRTHTTKEAVFGTTDVLLKGEFETARMTFAADKPAVLRQATAMINDVRSKPPTVMRWQTLDCVTTVTLASLLTRGADPVDLKVESTETAVKVLVSGKDWSQEVNLTSTLEPPAGYAMGSRS